MVWPWRRVTACGREQVAEQWRGGLDVLEVVTYQQHLTVPQTIEQCAFRAMTVDPQPERGAEDWRHVCCGLRIGDRREPNAVAERVCDAVCQLHGEPGLADPAGSHDAGQPGRPQRHKPLERC
jgi:hypothetical protein